MIEENRAYETQSVNKPLANISQLHCDPLYVKDKEKHILNLENIFR